MLRIERRYNLRDVAGAIYRDFEEELVTASSPEYLSLLPSCIRVAGTLTFARDVYHVERKLTRRETTILFVASPSSFAPLALNEAIFPDACRNYD